MKTPQQTYNTLNKAIGIKDIYLKREDLHKYGSHKGRSIPMMIKWYVKKENKRHFVISSSGNAALAAIHAVEQHNKNNPEKQINLHIYIGQKINDKKKRKLEKAITQSTTTLEQVERPKQMAFQKEKEGEAIYLRQSTDDLALEGYMELARELKKIPNLQAVFVATSSGTTAQALGDIYKEDKHPIQIHIIQTTSCHPIASLFDTEIESKDTSTAGAIVDHIAHRKEHVVAAIKNTHGFGWVVTNEDIKNARNIVREHTKIDFSSNGVLSIAGLQKAIKKGWSWKGPVACIISGE